MTYGIETERQPRTWMKFIGPFGKFDIDRLAEARGGVEGIRDLLTSGEVEGEWRNELEDWLRAQDEAATAAWVRQTTDEAEKKRAVATAVSLRKSRLMFLFAAVVFLCALGTVVWELVYLPLH